MEGKALICQVAIKQTVQAFGITSVIRSPSAGKRPPHSGRDLASGNTRRVTRINLKRYPVNADVIFKGK
jgi:hypothetical protein